MTSSDKVDYKDKKPRVVVSACRPHGDSNGTIKAIHSYSETHLMDYAEQLWVKRDRMEEPDSKKFADNLKSRIDTFLKK